MKPITRRDAIVRLLGAAVAPFGLHAMAQGGGASAFAQEAPAEQTIPAAPHSYHFYSLADADNGPLKPRRFHDKYGREIGYAAFEDGAFVIKHHYTRDLHAEEWIASRIGDFSILDGAVMVELRGDGSDTGCFGVEMRRQQYRDRRYIRANWLMIDPPTQSMELETDGIWMDMVMVAEGHADVIRPLHEWNQILFIAEGMHFQGWVNGVKVVEGENRRFGRGRIGLVAERMSRAPSRTLFRNLHVWDGVVPDPTTVWS